MTPFGFSSFTLKILALLIFIIAYALIVFYYEKKAKIIWGGVLAAYVLGIITTQQAFTAIDWNVLGIYVGMLFISELLIFSKFPDYLANVLIRYTRYNWQAILVLCFISGLISTVIENVAVVLIVAPVAFAICKKLKISPV